MNPVCSKLVSFIFCQFKLLKWYKDQILYRLAISVISLQWKKIYKSTENRTRSFMWHRKMCIVNMNSNSLYILMLTFLATSLKPDFRGLCSFLHFISNSLLCSVFISIILFFLPPCKEGFLRTQWVPLFSKNIFF